MNHNNTGQAGHDFEAAGTEPFNCMVCKVCGGQASEHGAGQTAADDLFRQYFVWVYEAGAQDRGDLPELTRQFKSDLYDLAVAALPEVRSENPDDYFESHQYANACGFNEAIDESKEALARVFNQEGK